MILYIFNYILYLYIQCSKTKIGTGTVHKLKKCYKVFIISNVVGIGKFTLGYLI